MSFRIYKDTRSPSLEWTLTVDGEPFDLTGSTVEFRMRAVGSSTLTVDADAVIVGTATNGDVRYDWQEGDTATAGDYLAWFRVTLPTSRVQETPEFAVEVVEHADSTLGLCTLHDVREAFEYRTGDVERDPLIEAIIPQVSAAIARECQREFLPTASASRTFLWSRSRKLDLTPYDLRTVTSLTVNAGTAQETTATADSDYRLLPVVSRDGVYTRVEFAPDFDPDVSDYEDSFGQARVTIAGAWGYAAVPLPVKRAAIITVGAWIAADVAATGLSDLDEPRGLAPPLPRQYAIPTPAWRLLSPYMRRTIR